MIIRIECLVLSLAACVASFAQTEPVELEQLVDEARAQNPELRYYEAEIAAARGERRASGAREPLELGLEYGRKSVRDLDGNRLGDGGVWSVTLTQRLEFPGRLALRKAIADRQIELAELGLAQFRAALSAQVRLAGYRVLAADQRAEATREVAARFQNLLDVLIQRDPAGIAPLLDTRIIEANALTLARRAREASQELQAALAALNQLRGAPADAVMQIAPREVRLAPLPASVELLALARANNFGIRARTAELEQQGFQVRLSRHERWPAITLAPYLAGEHVTEREREFGLGVSVPLPMRSRQRGTVEAAEARRSQAEIALLLEIRDVERRVIETTHAYQAQLAEIARWRAESVGRFREAAELGDQHYRLGALPISTYTELQKQYLDAMDALLGTQEDALATRAELEQLTGLDLADASATATAASSDASPPGPLP